MRKKAPKTKTKTLQDILDSDDELPTEYIDLPFVPACQVDNRFECTDEKKDEVHIQDKEQSEDNLKDGLNNDETVIARRYLNKKDTYSVSNVLNILVKKPNNVFSIFSC